MSKEPKERRKPQVTPSSGNVFADLGFENAKEMEIKALVAHVIASMVAKRKITQTEAAELFGIKQPDVSRLVNGRLMGFSLERLLDFLTALRQDVHITIKPHRGGGRGRLTVDANESPHDLAA